VSVVVLTPDERLLLDEGRTVQVEQLVAQRTGISAEAAREVVAAARQDAMPAKARVVKRGSRKTNGPAGGCRR